MLFLDTSALLKRYVEEDGTRRVLDVMDADGDWIASTVAYVEAQVTLCHMGFDAATLDQVRKLLRDDWERFLTVPVDGVCLARAAQIGCQQRVRMMDALHLAAADRLPRPFTFLTFDHRQARAAAALDFRLA